ncbi:hypothetical protein, partial [Salmonella sp. SAL4357]|uniref:hypothetical protein n=1 Tax=Salmonella sp. SAL4357 TaxID=3159878 RepID=UPI00397BAAE8
SFPDGSFIDANEQPGPFLPGNAPADWAGQVALEGGFFAYGAVRNFIISLVGGTIPVAADGTFNAADVSMNGLDGIFEYEVPGLLS